MTPESPEISRTNSIEGPSEPGASIRAGLERALGDNLQPRYVPPPIPDHELLRRIGTGAYGDVWMARNALGTLRAVKIVYRDRFDEERPYQREFNGILRYEPVSRSHKGLVQILHVGRSDQAGCFYYVMELADPAGTKLDSDSGQTTEATDSQTKSTQPLAGSGAGERRKVLAGYTPRTLQAVLGRRQSLPPEEAAQLALQLTEALVHLHAHGLVHRDVKPSNVIFVGGQPKLADIGLVTAAGDSRSFVGTEGFIPPEGPGSQAADLYGLGKLVYELSTGRDRMEFPQLPVWLDKLPDGSAFLELNEVITRACAPDPAQRYRTAAEMATDLRLFLAGHSLRDARKQERHLTWLRRFAFLACLSLVVAGLAVWLARREAKLAKTREQLSRQRAEAELALRKRAEAAEQDARQQLYTALVEQARTVVQSGEMGHRTEALEALRRASAISNSVELRREAVRALALTDLRFERELRIPPDASMQKLDPRFERLAVCRRNGPVEIRSTADDRLLVTLPASADLPAFYAKWSSDGRFLAVKRDHPNFADLEVWDVSVARRVFLFRNTAYGAFSFDPRRPHFTVGRTDGEIETWDLESGQKLSRVIVESDPNLIMIAADGERFAECHEEPPGWTVTIRLLTNGQHLASHRFADRLEWMEWHPSGAWVATADLGGLLQVLDSSTGEARTLGRHKVQAVLSTFSPDGAYLISGGWERELICWDMRTMNRAFTINLDSFFAQFRSDGRACAVAKQGVIQIHAFELPACDRELGEDLGGRLRRAAFSPDGRWLAVPGAEQLGLWDLNGKGPGVLIPEAANARVYFSGDGRELFASCANDCFHWRIIPSPNEEARPRVERIPLDTPQGFTCLAVASNRVAFTTTRGSEVVPLEASAGAGRAWAPTIEGINGLSPEARWLAVYRPFSSVLHLFETPGLDEVAALTNCSSFTSFEFSPTGDEIAVASPRRIEFWSTANWQRTREITNFIGVLFSPDGAGLWLSKDYRTAGLYDARDLRPLLPLPPGMLPLALSPDGRFLALSVDARWIQVWDLMALRKELRNLGIDWTRSGRSTPRVGKGEEN